MQQTIINTNALALPKQFAEKIGTERVIVREVDGGLLLLPLQSNTGRLRGMLKGKGFTTDRYILQKKTDKELEG